MQPTQSRKLDLTDENTRAMLLPVCRLRHGESWRDPLGNHVVGCGDAADADFVGSLTADRPGAKLAIHDPPYNLVMFAQRSVDDYLHFCRAWVENTYKALDEDAALYIWMGADQRNHFQPLAQFISMMAETKFLSRALITMRNQRGYGTQRNWMAVRQELLYYAKGNPVFSVQYTDIPKILRGYYKEVNGERKENLERSRSHSLRAGNVWVDIQQVFYRMEENVEGCRAQKPLKAIERIILASSSSGETVIDFFSHAGTTLLACERTGRRCITCDVDPICAEITIRRLERFRSTGSTGWQRAGPFNDVVEPPAAISLPGRDVHAVEPLRQ